LCEEDILHPAMPEKNYDRGIDHGIKTAYCTRSRLIDPTLKEMAAFIASLYVVSSLKLQV
jgi:hypothetical protein